MNILYLAHRIPYPPDKGDKIRSFHQIRYLAERHKIALICFVDDRRDLGHADRLREFCASVDVSFRSPRAARLEGLKGLFDGRAISVAAFDSAELRRAVGARLPAADVVVAFSSVMAQYIPTASSIPRLMDFVDVDSDKWRLYAERRRGPLAWIYRREADRLGSYESAVARVWDHSLFVSEREARILRNRVPDRPFTVLQNGVDLAYFNPRRSPELGEADKGSHRIVFTGVMDYFPNTDGVCHFAQAILPLVQARVPGARFVVVGRNPTSSVRALARLPGIEVTGTVPDVRPYLASAEVAVAPLRIARGLQNKILESMAMALPVVGTKAAFEGLDQAEGSGGFVADDPEAFAEHLVALLQDPALRREAGERARLYVERHHRWPDHGAALEAILSKLLAGRARPGREAVS